MAELYETTASLRIFGNDLDPDEITFQLGKRPDKSAKRGEVIRTPSGRERIARRGRWSITTARQTPGNLNAQAKALLQGTSGDVQIWRNITSRYEAEIFFAGCFRAKKMKC